MVVNLVGGDMFLIDFKSRKDREISIVIGIDSWIGFDHKIC